MVNFCYSFWMVTNFFIIVCKFCSILRAFIIIFIDGAYCCFLDCWSPWIWVCLSVCSSKFFSENRSKNFSDFAYCYGALWVGWSDKASFQGKIYISPKMAENGQKQPKIILFRLKTALRIFLIFGLMLVEMILYHSVQIACPGKFRFVRYGVKSSQPVRSVHYFLRFWLKTALRTFLIIGLMLVGMILNYSMETACPGKSWFLSYNLKKALGKSSRWSTYSGFDKELQ